ncbi:VPLPA-CTERM sorting domain-containing protein [uncultured Tateyamaria sp.]|uniref:VPLPA-CTERM sorting domain-containing protein n=1 Tax=uncultured Tateyamaria sp. TaxID=455651 RepID=UPI00260A3457|nr:VPLPA-CTERM sorting domain-containing protein [uncultured Tateyamaria sp.]
MMTLIKTFAITTVLAASMVLTGGTARAAVIHDLPKVTPATEANELAQVMAALGVMNLITLGRVDAGNIALGTSSSDAGIGLELDFNFTNASFSGGEPVSAGGNIVSPGHTLTAVLLVDGDVSSLWYDNDFANMNIIENGTKVKGISHVSYFGVLDATPVPLPAAGWLLLGAFGGMSVIRRRKAKTT